MEELNLAAMPKHIGLIPDGNRRWARLNGLPDIKGHQRGMENVIEVARATRRLGISFFTLWAFSSENWTRSKDEVAYLMDLYISGLKRLTKEFVKEKVRFRHLGRRDRISKKLLETLQTLEEKTKHFTENNVSIALDYGGIDEIIRAVKKIVKARLDEDKIDENVFKSFLDTKDLPNLDLIIRTGGEHRTSGFLTFLAPYAEMAFPNVYLPDFNFNEFRKVLVDFQGRDRRFGGDSVKEETKFKLVSKV